jgi:Superfamily I DNA and RNA helicases
MSGNILKFPYNDVSVNNQQFRIITDDINQNSCVISCVGSGKTTTLTAKISYMLYNKDCDPDEFFIATFTRNASKDMKQKINNYIGISKIMCGTFHSLGMKALNMYDYEFIDNDYSIDEIQYIFYDFLKSDKSIKFKERINYIFIDEFQDINDIQFNIIKELYKNCKSICVFGDDYQNIYKFRGSNIKYILNF